MSIKSEKSGSPSLISIYWSFVRIGSMMFGGGYAMLPLLNREIIDRNHWASEEELLDYYSLSQCTPGPIAINTATFLGRKLRGLPGAAVATVGVVTVPFLLILLIAAVLLSFWSAPAVMHAFHGIRAAVCALILSAVVRLFRKEVQNPFSAVMCLSGFCLIVFLHVSPVLAVLIGAISGILWGRFRNK